MPEEPHRRLVIQQIAALPAVVTAAVVREETEAPVGLLGQIPEDLTEVTELVEHRVKVKGQPQENLVNPKENCMLPAELELLPLLCPERPEAAELAARITQAVTAKKIPVLVVERLLLARTVALVDPAS